MGVSLEVNAIYEGDNLEIMAKFQEGSVDFIYADPPFFSNKQYEVIWKDKAEVRSFEDRWEGGIEHYITWMEPRLRECYKILKNTGSMYLHCDYHADAHLRILMDKIFGSDRFLAEIIWNKGFRGTEQKDNYQHAHDTILVYTKSKKYVWNDQFQEYADTGMKRYNKIDEAGKKYALIKRRHTDGTVYYGKTYPKPEGKRINDVIDLPTMAATSSERLGYPTQKPVALIEKFIAASSKKGDIIFDPFCGCGTVLVAAQKLERRWIGVDISPTACKLMYKRLKREFNINAQLIRGEVDLNYVKKLAPFEFQNWVVVDKFYGTVSKTKSGDFGVDGFTAQIHGGFPIQVKQSEDVGRNVIDNFETAMRRLNKTKGYVVALSFGRGAVEGAAEAKNNRGIDIILRTAQDLLDGKIE